MQETELNDILKECIADLEAIGIMPNKILPYVQVNNRLRAVWARVIGPNDSSNRYGKYVIEFAPATLNASDKGIRNTMMHEVIHCVDKCFCHTGRWKTLARKVSYTYNEKYGVIKRLGDYEEKGIDPNNIRVRKKKINYELYCPECGDAWGYTTYCKAIKYPGWYRCGKCKVNLKSRGVNGKEIT